ncbi:paraquat-inducible protein A [Metapseudomonas resinovorans]|uniref:Paraquat-inducible protein A n=1 Tax=Metapseudomonas resinovorans NBRC 106553 TaxID=1245471 RepID=S6BNI6_METRE|nr:paraquat-inducible protein A [Pseudomonas resinovorans]BAN50589.1 paraquat-inducible protein A [Pseudomonas resinovorans NBRC 106553]
MPEQAEQRPLADLPLHDLIACHECDLLMHHPQLGEEQKACCPRCGYELVVHRSHMERRALALVLTALLLFVPANFLPIMSLNLLGQNAHDTVWTGVVGLYNSGMEGVAFLVFLCSMVIPLVKLLCQLVVLLCIRTRRARGMGVMLYRLYHHLREWGMLEVYLMGILVSIVKLIELAELHLGVGLACFIALLLAQIWLEVTMSPHQVWDALDAEGSAHASH